MESDSENEFVDATDYLESDPVSEDRNLKLVPNNAYRCIENSTHI